MNVNYFFSDDLQHSPSRQRTSASDQGLLKVKISRPDYFFPRIKRQRRIWKSKPDTRENLICLHFSFQACAGIFAPSPPTPNCLRIAFPLAL